MNETGFILAKIPESKDGGHIKERLKDSSAFVHKKFGDLIERNVFDVALEYIQQLERERDAAVEDMQTGVCCETCAHYNTDAKEPPCSTCRGIFRYGNWQWRGVPQEVE